MSAKALEEWDAKHRRQTCGAKRPDGPEMCALLEGHPGPHGARRAAQVEGMEPVVTWESEPETEGGERAEAS